jgi:signal transduction histidine kinase
VLEREFERLLSLDGRRGAELAAFATAASSSREPDAAAALEAMREIAGRLLLTSLREQEARHEAEVAKQTIESFLAMVSHELRTPLNAIIGWCAMLRMHEGADYRHGLEVIERNAHAQLRIVEDLLDAARVTAATLKIEPSRVNLTELGHEAVDAVKPAADDKGVAVQLTMADDLPPMIGDPDRLRQVLLNLLTNAIKFTDAGGSVDVSVKTVAGRLLVVIRDTGRGIPSNALPHVFDRFHQGAATDARHHGLGLGLTIARALVELHGGHIEIASGGEHAGTTCTIDLPLVVGGGQEPPAPARLGG